MTEKLYILNHISTVINIDKIFCVKHDYDRINKVEKHAIT